MKTIFPLFFCVVLAGCAELPPLQSASESAAAAAAPSATSEPEEPATTVAPARAPNTTLATLGNAAEPGLWLKTPLVTQETRGRLTSTQTGQSLEVTLIPISGPTTAGSRASLAALQALGVPLTAISELRVDVL